MKIVAFDPGKSGAIAFLNTGGRVSPDREGNVSWFPMPTAGKEFDIEHIAARVKEFGPDIAIVERVHAMPGNGSVSMFSFGKGYGIILGVLGALSIPTELVTPQAWKKAVLAGSAKDKAAAIAYCRRAFPTASLLKSPRHKKPHDGAADALCLIEFARRTYANAG